MRKKFTYCNQVRVALVSVLLVAMSSCTIYTQGYDGSYGTTSNTSTVYDNGSTYNNGYSYNDDYGASTISFSTFYSALSPYGTWVNTANYGQVWVANVYGFRPYATAGRWVATDMGWSWSSDYPWGWAAFHYGNWGYDISLGGWFWVPGYQWSPAWVVWGSASSSMYGWAPLAPGLSINVSIGSIPYNYWTFLPNRYMGYSDMNRYYVNYAGNNPIYSNVTIVNNYYTRNNVRYAAGPAYADVRKYSSREITPVKLVQSSSVRSSGGVSNGTMTIYNPMASARNAAASNNLKGARTNSNNVNTNTQNNNYRANTNNSNAATGMQTQGRTITNGSNNRSSSVNSTSESNRNISTESRTRSVDASQDVNRNGAAQTQRANTTDNTRTPSSSSNSNSDARSVKPASTNNASQTQRQGVSTQRSSGNNSAQKTEVKSSNRSGRSQGGNSGSQRGR